MKLWLLSIMLAFTFALVPLQTVQPVVVQDNILLGYVGDICGQDQTIAVDHSNSRRVVVAAGSWYWYSTDGGVTWSGGVLSTLVGDPSLAFDNAGNAFWSHVGQVGSRCGTHVVPYQGVAGLGVSKSVDRGRSWSSVMLTNKTDPIKLVNDKEWIAIDRSRGQFHDRIYVVWNVLLNNTWNAAHVMVEGTFGGVYLSYSDDHGATFSRPTKLALDFRMYSLQIAIGRVGEVYLVGSVPYRGLNFLRSNDGGKSFGSLRRISNLVDFSNPLTNTKVRTQNYPFPSLAVDQNNGNIYVAWVNAESGDGDIMFSKSTDGGNSWSSPTRVNDDPRVDHADQLMPSIAVSLDGVVHVAWVDRRNDHNKVAYDIYYANSNNGGKAFSKNMKISTHSSNPNTLHDPTFIGDYLGIAAGGDGTVHVAWGGVGSDSRYDGLAIFQATIIYSPNTDTESATTTRVESQTETSSTSYTTSSALMMPQPPIVTGDKDLNYAAITVGAVAVVAISLFVAKCKRNRRV